MSDNHSINLADDNFVRSVINRQSGKLIAKSDFTHQDRGDLVQEVYVRATKRDSNKNALLDSPIYLSAPGQNQD